MRETTDECKLNTLSVLAARGVICRSGDKVHVLRVNTFGLYVDAQFLMDELLILAEIVLIETPTCVLVGSAPNFDLIEFFREHHCRVESAAFKDCVKVVKADASTVIYVLRRHFTRS
jgi:hypothetical protein